MGLPRPEISVGVRSGDTPPARRRELITKPPDILITTPESLFLMLTSAARDTLAAVQTVIVDEVHAVAATKRGAHLALSLERLDQLLDEARAADRAVGDGPAARGGGAVPVRAGADDHRRAACGQDVRPVGAGAGSRHGQPREQHDLARRRGTHRRPDRGAPQLDRVRQLATARRATHLTAQRDSRRTLGIELPTAPNPQVGGGSPAHIMGSGQAFGAAPLLARAHHGSVSKEQRAQVEDDLKSGRLKAVVATSSLELGIDMGAVDLVIQVEAPPSVASGLQRIGRAGHQVGEISQGVLFPKHRTDLIGCAVTVQRMLSGEIETMRVPTNPLDVLAQHTVAACALEPLDADLWFDAVRRSAPFATLPRSAFEATLDLLVAASTRPPSSPSCGRGWCTTATRAR